MNNPEYTPVDEFGLIKTEIKNALALPVLNYQYGYTKELNMTLMQWSKDLPHQGLKYPLLYLEQPFNIIKNVKGNAFYGTIDVLRVYIVNETQKDWKAADRMLWNFKPVIYPIYRELMTQVDYSLAFHTQSRDQIEHIFTDRYFWDGQESILNDAFDCSIVTFRNLMIANNPNCIPAGLIGQP